MNVNTYDATPLLDQTISTSYRKWRVFDDGSPDHCYPLWFELGPDEFWCGRDVRDAADTRREGYNGVSLDTLVSWTPNGKLV